MMQWIIILLRYYDYLCSFKLYWVTVRFSQKDLSENFVSESFVWEQPIKGSVDKLNSVNLFRLIRMGKKTIKITKLNY